MAEFANLRPLGGISGGRGVLLRGVGTELIFKQVKGKGSTPFPLFSHQPATAGCVRTMTGFQGRKVKDFQEIPWGKLFAPGPNLDPRFKIRERRRLCPKIQQVRRK